MALSYSFSMAAPIPADRVARELTEAARAAGLFDVLVTPELVLVEGAVTRRGMLTRVREERPQPWNPVVADLGFTPTASVAFALDKESEIPDQQDDMVTMVSGLLDRVPGDAVLHFQYETIWLLRRDGDLTLHERDDLWPARRLALVAQPFRRATHVFAEE